MSSPSRGPNDEGPGCEPPKSRRASVIAPDEDEALRELCSSPVQGLLAGLGIAGGYGDVDLREAILQALDAPDGGAVRNVLKEYGWAEDFGDGAPGGQVALRLRDDILKKVRTLMNEVPPVPHPQPPPEQQEQLVNIVKEASILARQAPRQSSRRLQAIPGQSRPGAPPSNQLNITTTSMFILSGDVKTCSGGFRYRLFQIIDSTAFERGVLLLIMANSITLTLDIPSTRDNEGIQQFLKVSEIAFLAAFTVEMLLKMGALGFVMHHHSYLRSHWNKMDFVIVITGYVSLAPGVQNYSILRLLRVARPLRVVNRVPQMKSIMNALIQSLPGMRDVFLLLAFLLVIFAIVGVQLFGGRLHQRCYYDADTDPMHFPSVQNYTPLCNNESCLFLDDAEYPCSTSSSVGRQCQGIPNVPATCAVHTDLYKDSVLNFDTFYSACLLVFKVISLDDWPEDLHNAQNVAGWGIWAYFLLITLFGAFFCINLFLAVLSLEYYRAKVQAEIEEDDFLKEEDEEGTWELGSEEMQTLNFEGGAKEDGQLDEAMTEGTEKDDEGDAHPFGCFPAELHEPRSLEESLDHKEKRRRPSGSFLAPLSDRRQSIKSTRNMNLNRRRSAEQSVAHTASLGEVKVNLLFRCRMRVKALVRHRYFNNFMLSVTLINVLVMTLDFHNAPSSLVSFINYTNLVCSIIFFFEMFIKMFGLGFADYFTETYKEHIPAMVGDNKKTVTVTRRKVDGYNSFDCVLVLISVPELILYAVGPSSNSGGSNFNAFRIFRLARMLRVLGKYPTLRQLLMTIIASVVAVAYLFLIMLLFIFICGVLGLRLFSNTYPPDSRANFNSLWESFLTVFIVITGESWATIMRQAMEKNAAAFLYFVPLFIFGNYMLINLFIAILIDEFMRTKEAEEANKEEEEDPEFTMTRAGASEVLQPDQQDLARFDTCCPGSATLTMPSSERKGFVIDWLLSVEDYFFGEARKMRGMTPAERADAWDLHGTSLAFFELGRTHPFRLALASIVMHPLFNCTVLSVILANVVFLAIDHPKVSQSTRDVLELGDITFTILFTVECLMKVIVMGLYEAKNPAGVPKAYLTHIASENTNSSEASSSLGVWNRMDMFVVVTAFAGIGIKELKLCRSLRTIRLVVHSEGIRVVIMSLFRALGGLANVTVVCLFLWLSFGIIAVQLFKGMFYYCNDALADTREDCMGLYDMEVVTSVGTTLVPTNRTWNKLRYNFDNLGVSMLTLFEVAVGEGWAVIMYSGIDARGVDLNPKRNANPVNALFFCCFVVVGQFFAMNLFVGMLIEVFTSSKATEEGSILMTTAQRKWVRANKLLSHTRLSSLPLIPVVRCYEGFCTHKGVKQPLTVRIRAGVVGEWAIFDKTEPICVRQGRYGPCGELSLYIVGSSCTLDGRINEEGACAGRATVGGRLEHFELHEVRPSTWVTAVTCLRKVCFKAAMHPAFDNTVTCLIIVNVLMMCVKHYNQRTFFDRLIETGNWFFVASFTVEALVKNLAHGPKTYSRDDWNKFDFLLVILSWVGVFAGGPGLNVLRIGRVFRLIKRAKNLQKLFGTLVRALPSLGNVSLLLVVTFFIFGVVGVELFGSITIPGNRGLTEYTNFKNVPYALITLYQVATTETWTDVMDGCMATEEDSQCKEADNTCGTSAAVPYFVLFMLVGSFALLNLFITIVLDEFNNLAEDDDEEAELPGWTGLRPKGALKTTEKLLLMDKFKDRWLSFDPLATGRIRASAFITIMRVWCANDSLTSCEVTDRWLLSFLARIAMPIDEQHMVRYEDAVQSLSKQLFQISLLDAMGIQKFVRATQWKGDEYLMIAHYFAIQKILSTWRRKREMKSKGGVQDNQGPPSDTNGKDGGKPENGSHLSLLEDSGK